jgi:hypothetical protein
MGSSNDRSFSPPFWSDPTPILVLGTGLALPGEPISSEELPSLESTPSDGARLASSVATKVVASFWRLARLALLMER